MYIELKNIILHFDGKLILDIDEISIQKGELISLLGPSGCGKSTLLRCITGLEKIESGEIVLDDEVITNLPTKERNIGFVFQNYALFPTMTVFENVAFGLKVKKLPRDIVNEKVLNILKLVDMTEYADKNVQLLSGGQRQRVALARSIVTEPKVLLLDEPLSALDARIRKQLQQDLRRIQRSMDITMIFVTHDQEEAMRISDRIFVMKEGTVVQQSSVKGIYQNPNNQFVAEFIGDYNYFEWKDLCQYVSSDTKINALMNYYIRPEMIRLTPFPNSLKIPVVYREMYILGNIKRYIFNLENEKEVIVDRLNIEEECDLNSIYIDVNDFFELESKLSAV